MKISSIVFVLVVLVILACALLTTEGFGGHHGGHGRHHGGRRGRGGRWRRGGWWPRRGGYGRGIYNYRFDYPWYYPWFLFGGYCKRGCGDLGNGAVGCVNPGYSPDQCIFASDCYGC